MEYITVRGKRKLCGEISLPAAKNAVLPIFAASLMIKGQVLIKDCQPLADVKKMAEIVGFLGGTAKFSGGDLFIDCRHVQPKPLEEKYTSEIRSSVFLLGPLLGAFGCACLCYPGGCEIGLRPIDLHIDGLKRLGVVISEKNGKIFCDGTNMRAGEVCLDFPSVGATENLVMASALLDGTTIIRNAAKEPEVRDLANFINVAGGKVYGGGTDTICVQGVKKLGEVIYKPLPDRIVAGTAVAACAVGGGKIALKNYCERDMKAVEAKFRQEGARITHEENAAVFEFSDRPKTVRKTETQPFPGFPTDMQPLFLATLCYARGTGIMVENLFESRYRYTRQLIKTGADITVKDRVAIVRGKQNLRSADMTAEDLRGGAALIVAALGAEGESVIRGIRHVDRGYYKIEKLLLSLGADISRKCDGLQE